MFARETGGRQRQRRVRPTTPSTSQPPSTTSSSTLLSRSRQCLAALLSPAAWRSVLSYLLLLFLVFSSQMSSSETRARIDLATISRPSRNELFVTITMDHERRPQTVPNDGLGMHYHADDTSFYAGEFQRGLREGNGLRELHPVRSYGGDEIRVNIDDGVLISGNSAEGSIKEEDHIPISDHIIEGAVQAAQEAAQNSRQLGDIENQIPNAVAEADKAFIDAELASENAYD